MRSPEIRKTPIASPFAIITIFRRNGKTSPYGPWEAAFPGVQAGQGRGRIWMSDMNGKVALITGASSGIGRATGEAFAARGAKVVLAARREGLNKYVRPSVR